MAFAFRPGHLRETTQSINGIPCGSANEHIVADRDQVPMVTKREQEIHEMIDLLIKNFKRCLDVFDQKPPFSREGQFQYHRDTIQRRLQLGSAGAALQDDLFLRNLYATLKAWGIGTRGSNLLPFSDFATELRRQESSIVSLDDLRIDDKGFGIQSVSSRLWQLIDSLGIVDNKAKLVPCSKALHHLLPDLVVPMDRAYTRYFFGWNEQEFQNNQPKCFNIAFMQFVRVARAIDLSQYVGPGWHTSRTKVLDNAIVGFKVFIRQLASN